MNTQTITDQNSNIFALMTPFELEAIEETHDTDKVLADNETFTLKITGEGTAIELILAMRSAISSIAYKSQEPEGLYDLKLEDHILFTEVDRVEVMSEEESCQPDYSHWAKKFDKHKHITTKDENGYGVKCGAYGALLGNNYATKGMAVCPACKNK